jgi:hypothetical protein
MMNRRFLADANELCRFGVGELSAGFGSGKFTPLEVAQATLARAGQVQERFNAFSLIALPNASSDRRVTYLSEIDSLVSQGFSRLSERAVMHLRFNVSRMDALTRSLDRGQYPYASSFTAFELVWIPGQAPN